MINFKVATSRSEWVLDVEKPASRIFISINQECFRVERNDGVVDGRPVVFLQPVEAKAVKPDGISIGEELFRPLRRRGTIDKLTGATVTVILWQPYAKTS